MIQKLLASVVVIYQYMVVPIPPLPGQEIILKYVDPVGKVTYRPVKTDADGCFDDFLASITGGTWQVSAEYPGGKCEAPQVEGPVTVCWCHNS